ncbi:acyltransferase domain-containing protein [Paenibacillus sp. S-38]|uniref:acyltransferase domain-containing protein n=1 Tax=Paenibacillus sp. S-38 TaxID=3416710 RepID=UPI003CF51B8E
MYSGQGSQYYGMGQALFQSNAIFHSWMKRLNDKVIDLIGESVLERLYAPGKKYGDLFDRTLYTHISIFMVECAATELLMYHGLYPKAVVGSSLGEFAAAVAAGVWDMDTALQAVIKQAQLLESRCSEGGMLAVLSDISLYESSPILYENCDLVSVNGPAHYIVSGSMAGIAKAESFLKTQGAAALRLPVLQGFHSPLMDPAAEEYRAFLLRYPMRQPAITYVSSLYGAPVDRLEGDYFWQIIRKPIRLTEALSDLREQEGGAVYFDLGPFGTMANMLKKLVPPPDQQVILPLITPFHQELRVLENILGAYANPAQPLSRLSTFTT